MFESYEYIQITWPINKVSRQFYGILYGWATLGGLASPRPPSGRHVPILIRVRIFLFTHTHTQNGNGKLDVALEQIKKKEKMK